MNAQPLDLLCREIIARPELFDTEDFRLLRQRNEAVDQILEAVQKARESWERLGALPTQPELPNAVTNALNSKIDCALNCLKQIVVDATSYDNADWSDEGEGDHSMSVDRGSPLRSDDEDKEPPPSTMVEDPAAENHLSSTRLTDHELEYYRTSDSPDEHPDHRTIPVALPHPYPCELIDATKRVIRSVVFIAAGRPAFHGMWAAPTATHLLPQLYPLPPGRSNWREFLVYTEGRYRPVGDAVDLIGRNYVVVLRSRRLSRGVCPGIAEWEEFSREERPESEDELEMDDDSDGDL
ncbi:hypothetical protein C8F04DRAFT_1277383 [Mycena alexandri]|uniref:Uncharacterized protein n=1 Tax=Mycena alexandri TaxID=1745969 RepID=A0AAD6S487_9AGAR|nr:hypothetical protein C8F04DRAFT_1277383 [Mycena alexandri]